MQLAMNPAIADARENFDALLQANRKIVFKVAASYATSVEDRADLAQEIAAGPSFGHAMTKRMLQMEWAMSLDQAIEAEAVAQALCMTTKDFRRAYDAFVAKQRPVFRGD